MSGTFQTDQTSVTLDKPPWSVTREISIYVQYKKEDERKIKLFENAGCVGDALSEVSLEVYRGQSTGLYFYIAGSSDEGTRFPDPSQGKLPLSWNDNCACPDTVSYGKVKADLSAFSMADKYGHDFRVAYGFNIIVDPGTGGQVVSTSLFEKVDPTIIEKGQDPPSGL